MKMFEGTSDSEGDLSALGRNWRLLNRSGPRVLEKGVPGIYRVLNAGYSHVGCPNRGLTILYQLLRNSILMYLCWCPNVLDNNCCLGMGKIFCITST